MPTSARRTPPMTWTPGSPSRNRRSSSGTATSPARWLRLLPGLLPLFLTACVLPSNVPSPSRVPAVLLLPCPRLAPPPLLTNADLANAYLDSVEAMAECRRKHKALADAVQGATEP